MSFKDRLAKTRQTLVDSNQDNLAHAYLYLEQAEEEVKKHLAKLAELRAKLEAMGDDEAIAKDADGSATRALYDEAMTLARVL
jgi:hypothetical protein